MAAQYIADGAAVCSAFSQSDQISNIQSSILGNQTSSPVETNKGSIKDQTAGQNFACGPWFGVNKSELSWLVTQTLHVSA